jgi:hypothetical protein
MKPATMKEPSVAAMRGLGANALQRDRNETLMTGLHSVTRIIGIAVTGLPIVAGALLTPAVAHEGHQMKCNKTSIQAMKVDIQAMNNGQAKTTALLEMKMAEDALAKGAMKDCETHMHTAMEAMEK